MALLDVRVQSSEAHLLSRGQPEHIPPPPPLLCPAPRTLLPAPLEHQRLVLALQLLQRLLPLLQLHGQAMDLVAQQAGLSLYLLRRRRRAGFSGRSYVEVVGKLQLQAGLLHSNTQHAARASFCGWW